MGRNSHATQVSPDELYTLLRNSRTFETERITAEFLLSQDGQVHRVERESVLVHIHEDNGELTVYVPRDERKQEVCFNSKLPRKLCEWLMASPTTGTARTVPSEAVNAVQSVLSAKQFALKDILDEHGIGAVDIANIDEPEVRENTTIGSIGPEPPAILTQTQDNVLPELEAPSRQIPMTPPNQERTESSDDESFAMATPQSSVASPTSHSTSYIAARSRYALSRPALRPAEAYASEEDSYLSLLYNVVRAARSTTFPSRGSFDMSTVLAALPGNTGNDESAAESYCIRSSSQIERDKKIGTAGELFVSIFPNRRATSRS